MSKKKYRVSLTDDQRQELQTFLQTGVHASRAIKRAKILLLADEGQGDPPIARDVGVCLSLPARVRRQYCQEGLQACLREKPRSGRPRAFSGHGEAALTVLACSDPPDGRCRWTHRLLADRVVELELLDSVAHTTIGRLLKKTT